MKKSRQAIITQIVEENKVTTQEELLQRLLDAGVNVTQATVSRDIKEMRIIKHPDENGEYRYCLPTTSAVEESSQKYMSILLGAAVLTDIALNTVVLKCHAGTAMAAAAALDSIELPGVAGCLAGDDTIFILCYSIDEAKQTKSELDKILGF